MSNWYLELELLGVSDRLYDGEVRFGPFASSDEAIEVGQAFRALHARTTTVERINAFRSAVELGAYGAADIRWAQGYRRVS